MTGTTGTTAIDAALSRVRKLLALATSSNEHEAASAAALAAEIMARHRIDQAMLEVEGDEPHEGLVVIDVDARKRRTPWRGILASGVTTAFGCRGWYTSAYETETVGGKKKRRLVGTKMSIVGKSGDVAAASYVFSYLVREINAAAAKHARPRTWRNSFRVGAASRVTERLEEARGTSIDRAPKQALVKLERDAAELDEFYRSLKAGAPPRASFGSSSAFAAGIEAGNQIRIDTNARKLKAPAPQLGTAGDHSE